MHTSKHPRHRGLSTLIVLAAACTLACAHREAAAPATRVDQRISITTASARGSLAGDKAHFSGEATISMLFTPSGARTFSGAYVTFKRGARTAWHSHPAGQTLVVTAGKGWVQIQGEKRQALKPGDVVWTPPGVRHWHGATASSAMTHLALQGAVDAVAVNWLGHVSASQYAGQ